LQKTVGKKEKNFTKLGNKPSKNSRNKKKRRKGRIINARNVRPSISETKPIGGPESGSQAYDRRKEKRIFTYRRND